MRLSVLRSGTHSYEIRALKNFKRDISQRINHMRTNHINVVHIY